MLWVSISTDFSSKWLCWQSKAEEASPFVSCILVSLVRCLQHTQVSQGCVNTAATTLRHGQYCYSRHHHCKLYYNNKTSLNWDKFTLARSWSHTDGDIDIRHSAVLTPAPGTAETTVLCSGYLRSLCADKPIINTDTFTTPVI